MLVKQITTANYKALEPQQNECIHLANFSLRYLMCVLTAWIIYKASIINQRLAQNPSQKVQWCVLLEQMSLSWAT